MSAFVDLRTGKIVGAKKGTKVWYHEIGHKVYHKSLFGMRNSFREESSFQLAVYTGVIGFFVPWLRVVALSAVLVSLFYFVFEETWCWVYAFKKFKKVKGGSVN